MISAIILLRLEAFTNENNMYPTYYYIDSLPVFH